MTDTWIDVLAVDAVPEGDVTAVTVNGKEIALYEVEGESMPLTTCAPMALRA